MQERLEISRNESDLLHNSLKQSLTDADTERADLKEQIRRLHGEVDRCNNSLISARDGMRSLKSDYLQLKRESVQELSSANEVIQGYSMKIYID